MRLRIKYCGGCKAEYDRPALAQALVAQLATLLERRLEPVGAGQQARLGLVFCGCPACCADRPDWLVGADRWHVIGPGLLDYHPVTTATLAASIAAVVRLEEG